MKKAINQIIKCFIICKVILFLMLFNTAVYAMEAQGNLELTLSTDITNLKTKKEVSINLSLTSFDNVTSEEPIAITGNIQYDETVFSTVTLTGSSGWSAEINNKKFVLDASKVSEGEKIATFTLKARENLQKKFTTVKLLNVEVVNDDNLDLSDLSVETKSIDLSSIYIEPNNENVVDDQEQVKNEVTTPKQETPNSNPSPVKPEVQQSEEEKPKVIEKVQDLTTVNDKKMPQTGNGILIYVAIFLIIIIGIYSYIRYKKMFK